MKTKPFKTFALWLMIPLMVIAAKGQSLVYSNAITSLNPAGYWPMHEVEAAAQGDIETNYGSLGVLGNAYYPDYQINSGAFIRSMPGPLGNGSDQSILFTEPANNGGAVTNSILVPRTSPLTTLKPPFTVEFWYMATNFPVVTWQGDLWSQMGDGGTRTQGIRIYYQNSGPSDLISVLTYGTASGQINIPSPAITNNVWHHLVVTCSATTNFTAWMDGVSVASGSLVGKYTPDNRTPFTVADGLGFVRSWHGLESEVAIYTNVITDIATHYTDGTNASSSPGQYYNDVINDNPVVYLRLNNPGYTIPAGPWPTLLNYGQTNGVAINNGVYTPGTLPGAVVGSTYTGYPLGLISTNVTHLSGVSSFADAGSANAYNPTGSSANFTVTAVFRGNPIDTNRVESIVGHGTNSWELGLTSLGHLVFNSGTNSTAVVATGSGAGDLVSTTYVNDGKWHQVVAVHSFTTNMLYVDGVANTTNILGAANNVGNSLDVMIGSDPCYTNTPVGWGRQFAGQICEVAFYTNVLTLAQVQTLYNDSGVPAQITQQPVSATVNAGVAFTNTVVASGSTPYAYQWYTNGVAIGGATNSSLILNPVLGSEASSDYYVVVTNNVSAVTSSVVSLTVVTTITITSQTPQPYTNLFSLYPGANPVFAIAARGPQINFSWYTNNVLDGADTTSNLQLSGVQSSFATYCVAGNSYGSVTSMVWTAQVLPSPVNSGSGLAPYQQAVMALNPIAYWRMNDANLDGADNGNGDNGYICNDYINGDNGFYTNIDVLGSTGSGYNPVNDPSDSSATFEAIYAGGAVNSILAPNMGTPNGSNAEFTVMAWANPLANMSGTPTIVGRGGYFQEEFTIDAGSTANSLRFEVRNAAGTVYNANSTVSVNTAANQNQWYHLAGVCDEANGLVSFYVDGQLAGTAAIPTASGITNTSTTPITIGNRSSTDSVTNNEPWTGSINDVAIFNYALTSNQVAYLFSQAGLVPVVSQEPTNIDADYGGGTTVFTAAVAGATNLQWFYSNGSAIAGQTNATLVVSNLTSNTSYYLVAYNTWGSNVTATVTANVIQGAPSIYSQPKSPFFATVGQVITNLVTAYGTWPLAYQWQYSTDEVHWANVSGYRISGQSNVLTISDVFPSDAGYYQCVVSNSASSTTSSPAQLTVLGVPLAFNTNGVNGAGLFWTGNGGNGVPSCSNDLLTLTMTNALNNAGTSTYFYQIPQYIGAFEASFTYEALYAGTSPQADGATFCIQNDPRGASALGLGGGDLAYLGNTPTVPPAAGNTITPSVALEFNIFPGNGVGGIGYSFNTNGGIGPVTAPGSVQLTNVPVDVTVYYANGRMALTFSNEVLGNTYSTNLNVGSIPQILGTNAAYLGFTGSYGGDQSLQTITNFSFVSLATQTIAPNGTNVVVSWPASVAGYTLQESSSLTSVNWMNVTNVVNVVNGQNEVIMPKSSPDMFYRLILLE